MCRIGHKQNQIEMNSVKEAIRLNKQLRIIGFDDSPFTKQGDEIVNISGIVCSNTRFEGMLWGEVTRDGRDATECLIDLVSKSKFQSQLHAVLIDGIAFGGFNIIDLPMLSDALALPCIAVMRKPPDMNAIDKALRNFSDYSFRVDLIKKAGEIHHHAPFYFQCSGIDYKSAGQLLEKVTDTGKVPEALRIAHLIGSAVKTGVSSNRA